MRRAGVIAAALSLLAAATPLAGQSLPQYASMNPLVVSRTGVATQPFVAPGKRWRFTALLDYASTIEYVSTAAVSYLLDAELLRADLAITRELGGGGFLLAQGSLNRPAGGFLDGFIDWYHDLFGFPTGARTIRPRNVYGYDLSLAGGPQLVVARPGAFLGDLRVGGGLRHSSHWQSVLSATLPTGGGGEGFARGVVSLSAVTTLRSDFGKRFTYEGSIGAGYAPTHGSLEEFQHTTFLMVSQGIRARVTGPLHLYSNLIYHSALYHDIGDPALDGRELTIDLGGFLKFRRGPEWILGLTEDLEPSGPAIDVSFRLGARW